MEKSPSHKYYNKYLNGRYTIYFESESLAIADCQRYRFQNKNKFKNYTIKQLCSTYAKGDKNGTNKK